MTFKTGAAVVEKGKHVRMLVQEEAVNGKVECAWFPDDGSNILQLGCFEESDLLLVDRKS